MTGARPMRMVARLAVMARAAIDALATAVLPPSAWEALLFLRPIAGLALSTFFHGPNSTASKPTRSADEDLTL